MNSPIAQNSQRKNMSDQDNITDFNKAKADRLRAETEKKENQMFQEKKEPIFNIPPFIKFMVLSILIIHIIGEFLPADIHQKITYMLGFVPAIYLHDQIWLGQYIITPFSHVFLHGGWLHLCMNIFTMMAFGAGLERALGSRKTALLFFATAALGAATHFIFEMNSPIVMIGASGGISGLFGAMIVVMRHAGMINHNIIPIVAIWIGISLLFAVITPPGFEGSIAWATHIGGFLAGLFLIKPIYRLKLPPRN